MIKLHLIVAIIVLLMPTIRCCADWSALNKVDVYAHYFRKDKGAPLYGVNFHLLDDFEQIEVMKANVTELCKGMIKNFPSLKSLSLVNVNLTKIHGGAFEETNLITLSLAVNRLRTIEMGVFNHLEELQILYLSANQIEDIHAGAFDNLVQLQKIFLNNNRLYEIDNNWFRRTPNLLKIDMSHNMISKLQTRAFELSSSTTEIDLKSNIIEVVDPSPVHVTMDLKEEYLDKPYVVLYLNNNQIKEVTPEFVQSMTKFSSSIILNKNRIECVSDDVLNALRDNDFSLHITQNPLSCECLRKLRTMMDKVSIRAAFYYENDALDFNKCISYSE